MLGLYVSRGEELLRGGLGLALAIAGRMTLRHTQELQTLTRDPVLLERAVNEIYQYLMQRLQGRDTAESPALYADLERLHHALIAMAREH